MKLLFKQKLLALLDSYDIYDEAGNVVYQVKGKLTFGHCLKIYDAAGREAGTVKQEVFTLLPKFELYEGNFYLGCIKKQFAPFERKYDIDFNGWHIEGDFFEWNYVIADREGNKVASISKELLHMTDTYILDIHRPEDALHVLMFVLAIDAEKCSRTN